MCHIIFLRQYCECVIVLLTIEQHIQASLLNVIEGEGVGQLTQNWASLKEATHKVQNLNTSIYSAKIP